MPSKVTITAEVLGFHKVDAAFASASRGLNDIAARAKAASERVRGVGEGLQSFGRNMTMKVTAPITAAFAGISKLMDNQIRAQQTLRAALRSSGNEVEENYKNMRQFAADLQQVTTVGDESTLQLMQLSLSMGVSAEGSMRAAKNAVVLSRAMNMNEKAAIKYTAALEQGDATMLTRYLPTLRQAKTDAEKTAMAQEILGRMFSVATEEAKVGLGPLKQAMNDFGDSMEEFGKLLQPVIKDVADFIKDLSKKVAALSPEMKKMILVFAAIAAVAGPLIVGLGTIVAILGSAGGVIAGVVTGFWALAAPIAVVAIKIGLVVAAVGVMFGAFFGLSRLLLNTAEKFDSFKAVVKSTFDSMSTTAKLAWAIMKGDTKEAMRLMKEEVIQNKNKQTEAWDNLKSDMKDVWTETKQDFGEAINFMGEKAAEGGKLVAEKIGSGVVALKDKIVEFTQSDTFQGFAAATKETLGNVLDELGNMATGIAEKYFKVAEDVEEASDDLEGKAKNVPKVVKDEWLITLEEMRAGLEEWSGQAVMTLETWGQFAQATFDQFKAGVGDAVASAIVEGEDLATAMEQVLKNVAKSVISTLVQIAIQKLAQAAISALVSSQQGAAEGAQAVGTAAANAYSSTAAIPIIGPTLAPAAAATALAGANASLAAGMAAGAATGAAAGAFAGGIEDVPSTGSFVLHRGEKVLSVNQNKELMDRLRTLEEQGGLGGDTFNITFATDALVTDDIQAEAFADKIEQIVARKRRRARGRGR